MDLYTGNGEHNLRINDGFNTNRPRNIELLIPSQIKLNSAWNSNMRFRPDKGTNKDLNIEEPLKAKMPISIVPEK